VTHTTPNDTTRDPADDPRLTAYALGELAGDAHASDRAAVEAVLARDPAARAFVDETRALGVALRDEYLSAPAASMSDAQRATVMARAAAPSQGVAPKGQVLRVSNWSVPAGIAAALLVGTAFSYRHEIGGWWTGGRDVAQSSPGGMRYTHERPRDLLAADEGDDGARGAAQRAGERRAERDTNAPKPPSARPSTASGASMPAMPAGGPPQAAPVVPPAPPRVP
jgi:hypothetical protein